MSGDQVVRGLQEVADVCRVNIKQVEIWVQRYPSFPARRDKPGGMYLSTQAALLDWMGRYCRGKVQRRKAVAR